MNQTSHGGLGYVWRIIYPALTYNAITYFFTFLAWMLALAASTGSFETISSVADYMELTEQAMELTSAYACEIQMLAALVTIPVLILFCRMDAKRLNRPFVIFSYGKNPPLPQYALIIAVALAASMVGNNLIYLTGLMESSEAYSEVVQEYFQGHMAAEILGLGIIIPIAEEMIYRGLMYNRLKEYLPLKMAVFMCALCFGLVHGNTVQGIFSFFMSLLMIYLIERYHDLRASILFHMTSNLLAVVQQETGLLTGLYSSTLSLSISTLVMAAVLVLCIYLVEKIIRTE